MVMIKMSYIHILVVLLWCVCGIHSASGVSPSLISLDVVSLQESNLGFRTNIQGVYATNYFYVPPTDNDGFTNTEFLVEAMVFNQDWPISSAKKVTTLFSVELAILLPENRNPKDSNSYKVFSIDWTILPCIANASAPFVRLSEENKQQQKHQGTRGASRIEQQEKVYYTPMGEDKVEEQAGECLSFNTSYTVKGTILERNSTSNIPVVVQTYSEGMKKFDNSDAFLQTFQSSGHLTPLSGFYPVHLADSTPKTTDPADLNQKAFSMTFNPVTDTYVVSAIRNRATAVEEEEEEQGEGEDTLDMALMIYDRYGIYQNRSKSLSVYPNNKVLRGVAEPSVVNQDNGDIVIIVSGTKAADIANIEASFNIQIDVPAWVTWKESGESYDVILILSGDLVTLRNIYMLPVDMVVQACVFDSNAEFPPKENRRYVVCLAQKDITAKPNYKVGHVIVLDTQDSTIQTQPIPGSKENKYPSSSFNGLRVLGNSPCLRDSGGSAADMTVLLFGSEGEAQYKPKDNASGSRAILTHVNITHMMDSTQHDDRSSRVFDPSSSEGPVIKVPNVVELPNLTNDNVISHTVLADEDMDKYRNGVEYISQINTNTPTVYLLTTLKHGYQDDTDPKDLNNKYVMQLVDICSGGRIIAKKKHDAGMSSDLIIAIVILSIFSILGVMLYIFKRKQDQWHGHTSEKHNLLRDGQEPVLLYG